MMKGLYISAHFGVRKIYYLIENIQSIVRRWLEKVSLIFSFPENWVKREQISWKNDISSKNLTNKCCRNIGGVWKYVETHEKFVEFLHGNIIARKSTSNVASPNQTNTTAFFGKWWFQGNCFVCSNKEQ